ncbi:MAG: hypothetical protein M1833_003924 [Piccolia ochrophora]|nr:MAG: hypothetical protein M1833_003924 [Piccolia ochrophora]
MTSTPFISVREYIRWLPHPAHEPTATLVLTSSSRKFIDVRILNPQVSHPHPYHRANPPSASDRLPRTRLDWAFAGTSSSTPTVPSHCAWTHTIDSRDDDTDDDDPPPTPVPDAALCWPLPDDRTLERGTMVNPATGVETAYEELWRDVEAVVTAGNGSGSGGRDAPDGKRVCVVLEVDDEWGGKGVVIRVGGWCQGVFRAGREPVSVERYKWVAGRRGMRGGGGEDGGSPVGEGQGQGVRVVGMDLFAEGEEDEHGTGEGKWERVVKIGERWMPCTVAMMAEEWSGVVGRPVEEGMVVEAGDARWTVTEKCLW